MRLIRAELLKARRRSATWIVLVVTLVLMGVLYLLSGPVFQGLGVIEFPAAYVPIGQFAYGLGGLLALIYAAAFIGADWNWGVIRNVVARGESRVAYLLAKAAALAILLGIALLILFAFGIVMSYVTGLVWGVPVASPLRGDGLTDLLAWIGLGFPVLLQRAAIGFTVAVLLRSQLAGAIVGVLFFFGESIVRFMLLFLSFGSRGLDPGGPGFQPLENQWYQFLPITIGDYVVGAAPGSINLQGALEGLLIEPVPLNLALPAVLIYLALTVGLALVVFRRQEIA
jgi:ABC-type transport system involved in multi-copper enzyme maturation permease subunit